MLSQQMLLNMFRSGIQVSQPTILNVNTFSMLPFLKIHCKKVGAQSVHAFDIPDVFSKALEDVATAHAQSINSLELEIESMQQANNNAPKLQKIVLILIISKHYNH